MDLISIHNKTDLYIDLGRLNTTEKMILILEDRRFFKHFGIDTLSVFRELFKAMLLRRHGGASTIDMQWVRTITGYRENTISRKLYEMFLSIIIQQRYDKLTIFRSYLQIAYLGHRLAGIDQAAARIFGKSVMMLDLDEAAEIAAMFVYPRPSVPPTRWRLKLERRKNYAKILYPRYEKRFEKLPRRKIM